MVRFCNGHVGKTSRRFFGIPFTQGNRDWSGSDTLSLNITDRGNVGTGGARSAVGRVNILVASVNDPPVIGLDPDGAGLLPTGGALGTDEDIPLSLALLAINDTEIYATGEGSAGGGGRLTVSLHCSNGRIGVSTGNNSAAQGDEAMEGVVWAVGGLAEGAGAGPWQVVSFSGGLAETNEVLRKMEYSAAPDWHGVDDLHVSQGSRARIAGGGYWCAREVQCVPRRFR